MKNFKRTVAGVSALTLAMSMTACGGADEGAANTTEATTTTAATVEINTATLAEEEQATLDTLADEMLRDVELENKTIKWLAHYDINPSGDGKSESVALNLFKSKYQGEVQWYQTTWDNRYNDLSNLLLGGEGIDFFPCDTAALPKGVVTGQFQPVDDLIDMDSELWKDMKAAYEIYNFNGKHYEIVNNVSAEQICWYSKQTIADNGLDDPWELYKAGNWNWETFESMLTEFVSEENGRYGLDCWYNEKALLLSAGVPSVTSDNGHLKVNLKDATIEKALNWQYDLFSKGLVLDQSQFDWSPQFQFMGEGKELFYLIGEWDFSTDPETWKTKMQPDDLGAVPVPSPKGSDPYCAATLDGWVVCKGAANPEGVALFAECNRLANLSDEAIEIGKQKLRDDAHWSDELIDRVREIDALAAQYPVVDLATGISTDVASLTTDGGSEIGLRAPFHGNDWATVRDEISAVVEELVAECDGQIAAAQ